MNWLLVFIPVALALEHFHAGAPWVFFAAALAIVPIASLSAGRFIALMFYFIPGVS